MPKNPNKELHHINHSKSLLELNDEDDELAMMIKYLLELIKKIINHNMKSICIAEVSQTLTMW